jgi:hypothetical protein
VEDYSTEKQYFYFFTLNWIYFILPMVFAGLSDVSDGINARSFEFIGLNKVYLILYLLVFFHRIPFQLSYQICQHEQSLNQSK